MMQCVVVCCNVLQRVAVYGGGYADAHRYWYVCCSVLQYVAVFRALLQCVVMGMNMLAGTGVCVAVCCSVLQCVIECRRVLQYVVQGVKILAGPDVYVAVCCSVLQSVGVCGGGREETRQHCCV